MSPVERPRSSPVEASTLCLYFDLRAVLALAEHADSHATAHAIAPADLVLLLDSAGGVLTTRIPLPTADLPPVPDGMSQGGRPAQQVPVVPTVVTIPLSGGHGDGLLMILRAAYDHRWVWLRVDVAILDDRVVDTRWAVGRHATAHHPRRTSGRSAPDGPCTRPQRPRP